METADVQVTKVKKSRLHEIDFSDLPFGKYFSDHMLEADYENGEWKNIEIIPTVNGSLSLLNHTNRFPLNHP